MTTTTDQKRSWRSRLRRPLALLAGLGVVVAAYVVAMPSQAAVLGRITFDPSSGSDSSSITLLTNAQCDGGTNIQASMSGGPAGNVFTNQNVSPNQGQSAVVSGAGYAIPLVDTMRGFAQTAGFTSLSGRYDFTITCKQSIGSTTFGTFTGSIFFTSQTAYSSQLATSTTLAASPASPQVETTGVTFTATESPATAGSVQFFDGVTTLGSPVAVVSGKAALTTSALTVGSHDITATFTPTNGQYATSSSSVVTYVVGPLPAPAWRPALYGAARVGYGVACVASFTYAASVSYHWYLNGVVQSPVTASLTIPEAWYGKTLTCSVAATNKNGSATGTSAGAVIGVGPALRATVAPTRTGTARVGYTSYCSHGTWTPAATSYLYQWRRNGAAIAGATRYYYKTVAADKGRYLTCTVTARRMSWTNGVATTARALIS